MCRILSYETKKINFDTNAPSNYVREKVIKFNLLGNI